MHQQPLLHDLVTCVRAPTTVLSGRDGQVRPDGAQGAFCADLRVLSRAVLCLDGLEPEAVLGVLDGPGSARFTALARTLGDPGPDPTVRVERSRTASADGLVERVVVTSTASVRVESRVELHLEVDLASVHDVKAGRPAPAPQPGAVEADAVGWSGPDGLRVTVRPGTGGSVTGTPTGAVLTWPLALAPGAEVVLTWQLRVTDPGAVVAAPPAGPLWTRPSVQADDPRLPALVEQSLDDLDVLRLALPGDPSTQFLAAGSPWFLTLFGRDSLWAARMALPLGTSLAAGTLAVLAGRQGRRDDPSTGEAPGKVLHELRRAGFALGDGVGNGPGPGEVVLPPVYYGTVDATLLWVLLLHDAWRWGLDPAAVSALLPSLEAAVSWMTGPAADPDGDGFLEYVDSTGTGLSNQGWKDSGDAVRFRDGSFAKGPVALAEVQGYAYEAAGCAAALLSAFGRPGADRLLQWQDEMGARFRASFWVDDAAGAYPALALDGDKRRVDALTSNPGHLLGTGLLTPEEARLVAGRLAAAPLASGFGLRTMSTQDAAFSPLSYHCGSVWPHDTAIAVSGLVREGFGAEAAGLVAGLLRAAPAFEQRLPELFAGDAAARTPVPVPYPAACRPQAWSAAAGVSVLRDLLGLSVDVPAGVVRLAPLPDGPVGALRVTGLAVGDGTLDVELDRTGAVVAASTTGGLRLEGAVAQR